MPRLVLVAAMFLAFAAGAMADAPTAPRLPKPLKPSIGGWGAAHPKCLEWSNGCQICARGERETACSTPGIACVPGVIVCRRDAP